MLFIMQSARRVADDDVDIARLCRRDSVIDNRSGVAALFLLDDLGAAALCPDVQLVDRRRTEGIGSRQQHVVALVGQQLCHLADGRGLADAVDTGDKNDGGKGGDVQLLAALQHFGDGVPQQKFDGSGIRDVILLNDVAQLVADFLGGGHAHVAHNQQLLQLLKQFVVNLGEGAEHRVDLTDDSLARLT